MKKIFLLILAVFCIMSCSDLREAQENIDDLYGKVESLANQLKALQDAYDDGMIIKDVTALEDGDRTGWVITFSDNSKITLLNGQDAPISVVSIEKDELNGTIKLIMSDGSEYLFNLDVSFPTSVVVLTDKIYMPTGRPAELVFRINPSNAVVDLNLDQENPMFELDMAVANMTRSYVTPSENYILEKVEADKNADGQILQGQYKAYIRDVEASGDYCEGVALVVNTKDANGESIQISSELFTLLTPADPQLTSLCVNGVYAEGLENEFITVRVPYGTDVTALKTVCQASEGTVTANGVTVDSEAAVDFSAPVKFTITTQYGRQYHYVVTVSYSDLPVVYINTKDAAPIKSKTTWLTDTEIYITNAGEHTALYSAASIRGRGNTTWGYPKKPYAIKLDSKEEVLGMPKHKRWVLLANYLDKTGLRNSVSFEIARRSPGLDWTPRGQHVDVVLNGKFQGTYYLCEQIKGDKNRVPKPDDGYLLEIDKNFDEVNKFYSPVRNMPFMIKEPEDDEISADQISYIQNRVTEIENALYGAGSTTEGYLKYIDLDSFIDYWFVYELTSTGEPTHPKSVYMWTDEEGKFHQGPVWDFDYFTYQPFYNTKIINMHAVWSDRILLDPNNAAAIKARWAAARDNYRTIAEEIDRQYALIKESVEYNATIWPLNVGANPDDNANRDSDMSVKEAVARMKGFYETHFQYMDSFISTLYEPAAPSVSGENSTPVDFE